MRVLIISHGHPSFSIGGAEVASYTLFQAINQTVDNDAFYLSRAPGIARRHLQTPLMSLGHGEREAFFHTGEWDEFWLSNAGLDDLQGPLARYLLHLSPDVVHFHHLIGLGVEALSLVKRVLPSAKIIFTFHEYLSICYNHGQMVKTSRRDLCRSSSPAACSACFPQQSPAHFFGRYTHLRHHLEIADAFVSPSHFLATRYIEWGLNKQRFSVIENGVAGKPAPVRPIGIDGRRDRFGFFGQITEFKGLHIILEAITRVPEDVWGDATLSVFGGNLEFQPESFRSRFERLMEQAGRRARFCGSYRQDELAGLMAEIDWVITPSIWWENSPVVIQEAFMHGRPLIVSGIGGMAEKVQHDVNGLHFRVSSPESLAERIGQVLQDASLWPRLSANLPRPPSPEVFAHEHLNLYQSLHAAAYTNITSNALCSAD